MVVACCLKVRFQDILPLLITPSPAVPLHAFHALNTIHPSSMELPSHAQLRALLYAVRWESTIPSSDFLSSVLEGERWLVLAAGNVRLLSGRCLQ
jgi:hypothetical protein